MGPTGNGSSRGYVLPCSARPATEPVAPQSRASAKKYTCRFVAPTAARTAIRAWRPGAIAIAHEGACAWLPVPGGILRLGHSGPGESDADCLRGGCFGQVCQSRSEDGVVTTAVAATARRTSRAFAGSRPAGSSSSRRRARSIAEMMRTLCLCTRVVVNFLRRTKNSDYLCAIGGGLGNHCLCGASCPAFWQQCLRYRVAGSRSHSREMLCLRCARNELSRQRATSCRRPASSELRIGSKTILAVFCGRGTNLPWAAIGLRPTGW